MTGGTTAARRRLVLVGAAIVVLSAMGIAAAAATPVLVRDHPALLLVLESRNRYLLLVADELTLATFLLIGVPRRLASDPFYFLLGRWYGERAVAWVAERTPGNARWLQHTRRNVDRIADVLVFFFPGALVCVVAGAGAMSWRRFLTLNILGSATTVLALWWLADRVSGVLAQIVAFNNANAGWLTLVTAATVLVWLVLSGRRNRGSAGSLRDLEESSEE